MHVQALGHVVLKVRNLQRSEDFYSGMLGMPIISRISDPAMTFFALETSGNHHDFALMEVGLERTVARRRHHWACSRGIQGRRFSRGVRSCTPLAR